MDTSPEEGEDEEVEAAVASKPPIFTTNDTEHVHTYYT